MKRKGIIGLAIWLLLLGLVACAPDSAGSEPVLPETEEPNATVAPDATTESDNGEEMDVTEEPAGIAANVLWDSEWVLTSLGPEADPLPAMLVGVIDLAITDGRVSGHAGCNTFSGDLVLTDTEFVAEMLAVTAMACEDAARMSFESDYLQALGQVTNWSLEGELLTLSGDDVQLTYMAKAPQPETALVGTEWQFNGVGTGSGDSAAVVSPVVGTTATLLLTDGTVSGSTGCNNFNGSYTLAGDSLSITKLLHTMRACDELIGGQESAILTGLQNVVSWTIDGRQLRLYYPDGFLMYVAPE